MNNQNNNNQNNNNQNNNNQKTIIFNQYIFYEEGNIIKINLKKESDLPVILEKLKKNRNIKKLYVPKDIYNKIIFQKVFYEDLFSNFSSFDIEETSKNFIITKKKMTKGTYICLPFAFFWKKEKLKNIVSVLKKNKNLKYIYAENYLTDESLIKTLIKLLGFTIKINKSTSKYFLYELKKK